jgi:VanZ family protein
MEILKWILRFWKPVGIAIVIFILCLFPAEELQKLDVLEFRFTDLIVHLLMFLTFSAVLYYDLRNLFPRTNSTLRTFGWAFLVSMLLAITTEMLQYFLAALNRNANLVDLVFDCLGSVIGIWLARLTTRKSGPGF